MFLFRVLLYCKIHFFPVFLRFSCGYLCIVSGGGFKWQLYHDREVPHKNGMPFLIPGYYGTELKMQKSLKNIIKNVEESKKRQYNTSNP